MASTEQTALARTATDPLSDTETLHRRMPWPSFLLRAGLSLLLVLGSGAYLAERFRIGYDDQKRQCLPPHRWFLIDRHDRAVTQGALVAFAAVGLQPYFHDGQIIIKHAAGVPGDRIQVSPESVRINGAEASEGLALAGTIKRPPSDFLRDERVPPCHLWMMGATADSFDSRYWGFLPQRQVIGRAYALW
jgi:conjugal transfer pilin signal peptidase TrbI